MPTSPFHALPITVSRCTLHRSRTLLIGLLALSLAACGGGDSAGDEPAFTIGGTLSGLNADSQITLRNNESDEITLKKDGTFSFPTPVIRSGAYAVAVVAQPSGQTCSVTNGSSTSAGATANVTTVKVVCSTITQAIGGTVTGLGAGKQLTLLNNGSDVLTLSADGSFTFATPVPYGKGYQVTVGTQPANQTCSVSGAASGSIGTASIVVTCLSDATRLASGTQFDFPSGIAVDSSGTVYVSSYRDGGVYVIPSGATKATPLATSFSFSAPLDVGVDPAGNLIIIDNSGDKVLKWSRSDSTVTRLVTGTTILAPWSVAVDASGNVYVSDAVDNTVYKIAPGATTATPIATGTVFNRPDRLAVDAAGNVYVAEGNGSNYRILKISPGASTATPLATGMSFSALADIAVDTHGNLFITAEGGIYKITPGAATGVKILSTIQSPQSLALDASDNLYVTDGLSGHIYKIIRP
ncbi:MAG: hypothetical protein QM639_07230 [Rhodocyclaceae bacterium]